MTRALKASARRSGEVRFQAVDVTLQAGAKEGDPASFEMVAYNGGVMDVGFGTPVVVDLGGLKAAKSIPILVGHDRSRIVGHSTEIKNSRATLAIHGMASGANDDARQVIESGRAGFPWQASIGANLIRTVEVKAGKTVVVNGQTFNGPLLVARESQLKEVSFVALGADETTSVKIAAGAAGAEEMTFEAWLAARGHEGDLSDEQTKTLRAAYDAELAAQAKSPPAKSPETPPAKDLTAEAVKQTREALAAEHKRIADVTAAAGEHADLAAQAIREGWDKERTAERAELLTLRAQRPEVPAGHVVPRDRDTMTQAVQAAAMLSAGLPLDHHLFGSEVSLNARLPDWCRRPLNDDARQKVMEAAHRFRGLSTYELLCESLRCDGRATLLGTHNRSEIIQAALTGGTFTNVMTSDVNAVLLASFMDSEDTTQGWVQEEDVADFRTQDRLRLTKGRGLRKHKRGGTAEHNDRSDVGVAYKLARYSEKLEFDEQDIIDDRLSVLTQVAQEMGEDAKLLRPDLVYYLLLSNPTFSVDSTALFHADHSNLQTSSALAEATLKSAIALMEKQRENGRNLQIRTIGLIVPTELKHTAAGLLQSDSIITGSDVQRGSANTIKSDEAIRRITDARLSNGVTDPDTGTAAAGSSSTWFTVGNSHTIRVGYLRGRGRQPVIRSYQLTEGRWGMGWDINFDIGAGVMDYRSFTKSTA